MPTKEKPTIADEKSEIDLLRIVDSSKAKFVAVYGRRRVGKTFLIQNDFFISANKRGYTIFADTRGRTCIRKQSLIIYLCG